MSNPYVDQALAQAAFFQQLTDITAEFPAVKLAVQNLVTGGGGGGGGGSADVFNVKSFPGVVGDGLNDDTAGLHAARDFIAGCAHPPKLMFPAGIYKFSTSPNWGINNATYDADGDVRFRNTGSGPAVILDGGAEGERYNCHFGSAGRFRLESTTGTGIFARAFHRSGVKAIVNGCGSDQAALRVEFAVCSNFDIHVSNNFTSGWYQGARPEIGILLNCRNPNEPTSYCYFPNPIIEGCGIGIRLVSTLGNNFIGGTSEGHVAHGVEAMVNARGDKFIGVDFEANGGDDVRCSGSAVRFIDCDSLKSIAIQNGARLCEVRGGEHKDVSVGAGAWATTITGILYNRLGGGNLTKHNDAVLTVVRDCRNAQTGAMW